MDGAPPRHLAVLLALGGLAGLIAAVVLLIEKIALIADPSYVPSCSINPVLSCGSVMTTPQAEAFGVPNPLIGVAGFAVVTTVGVGLFAGARYRRWFYLGLQAGVTFGVVFVHWLIFQSLYRIEALCPYCMVVWVVTIAVFWYTTLHNVDAGHVPLPRSARRTVRGVAGYHGVVLTGWYLTVATLILIQFWTYWQTLL
ncbi:vitamin K epoxide reductase family protein [Georgenia subflava]|uniref:Vitamin K epoxide reductase n=1 Tax=Georgenia subflava TaxID=1622177 RepID=A0A6N7EMZ0_9MICO|nr:vitamin K epoxide reductase family protein [Georgenia subflava]MPV37895.1 Vitamin K epoxide reductase [Georgenia subflava]